MGEEHKEEHEEQQKDERKEKSAEEEIKKEEDDGQVSGHMSLAPIDREMISLEDAIIPPPRVHATTPSPAPTTLKVDRHPASFHNSRLLVNMSSCSSPDVFRTIQKSPSRRGSTSAEDLDAKAMEVIKELDDRRRRYEREGNYISANAAVEQLAKLKADLDDKRRAAMISRQMKEREMARTAYVKEMDARNKLWGEKLKRFHVEVMEHAATLKCQHTAALEALRNKMTLKTPSKPQWSSELLKLRKVQECLGKQCKYVEAQEVKRKADQMEQNEMQATIQAYHNEIACKEHMLRSKQHVELEVLLQRAAQARDELRRNKEHDLSRCRQRHKNVVRELKVMHSQETFKFDQILSRKRAEDSTRRASFLLRKCDSTMSMRPSTASV